MLDPLAHRRCGDVALDDDLRRVDLPTPSSRSSASEAVLRRIAVGDRADAGRARAQVECGQREQDQHCGRDERGWRAAAADPGDHAAPEPSLARAAADERQPQRVDAVAEQREDRRQERQRRGDRGQADEDGSGGEATEDRVRHEQHSRPARSRTRSAEEDGAAGRSAGRGDRLDLLEAARPLLAEAADDEERVVDAERQPHPREHVDDEERDLPDLADDRDECEREDDRDEREQDRDQRRDDRAEDE